MRIHVATDHAGLEFSRTVQAHVVSLGHEVIDHGPVIYDPLDDYPGFCIAAARAVAADQAAGREALGIIFGGSGNGEQIAANKVPGIRAALVWNDATAALGRDHNDANVISIGARQHPVADVMRFIDIFLATPFSADIRHVRRIGQIGEFETSGTIASIVAG